MVMFGEPRYAIPISLTYPYCPANVGTFTGQALRVIVLKHGVTPLILLTDQ